METVDPTVFRLAIFVLAIFVGYYVVWSVTPALHTPLMAVTNAISSVIIVGALLAAAAHSPSGELTGSILISKGSGAVAAAFASVNIFGGFLVVRRMLAMYKKKAPAPPMDFGVGYRWRPNESNLLLAVRNDAATGTAGASGTR